MKTNCPNVNCKSNQNSSLISRSIVPNGSFFRKSDSRKIRRYQCRVCNKYFSAATFSPCFAQKKRRINPALNKLLCAGVSQRRAAIILKVDRKTVVRRFRFLAAQARIQHEEWLTQYHNNALEVIQFDDLETSEHTKCKPLSVALAVDPICRKILNYQVAQMPAKGHLSKIAYKKYGPRPDQRGQAWDKMMKDLKPIMNEKAHWTSDENPHYPKYLFRHHPHATHTQVPGGRGCITGQGELKKKHFDPMFSLNHTCAMLRANLNRLFRKTWCTTKTRQGLLDHLAIFVLYFNRTLTQNPAGCGAS